MNISEAEYDKILGQIRYFTRLNGIRRSAKMLGVSQNTLQKYLTRQPIRPTSFEKIYDNFMR